jgi:hypothetical protein
VVLPVKRNHLGFMRDLRLLCCLRNKQTIADMRTPYKQTNSFTAQSHEPWQRV